MNIMQSKPIKLIIALFVILVIILLYPRIINALEGFAGPYTCNIMLYFRKLMIGVLRIQPAWELIAKFQEITPWMCEATMNKENIPPQKLGTETCMLTPTAVTKLCQKMQNNEYISVQKQDSGSITANLGNNAPITIKDGEIIFNKERDLLLQYKNGEFMAVNSGVSTFKKIKETIDSCYIQSNMQREGDPLLWYNEKNPVDCSYTNLNITAPLTYEHLIKYIETMEDEKLLTEKYGEYGLRLCFNTRSGTEPDYLDASCYSQLTEEINKLIITLSTAAATPIGGISVYAILSFLKAEGGIPICLPYKKLLDTSEPINFNLDYQLPFTHVYVSLGKVTCSTQKLKEDMYNTQLGKKEMKLTYHDDNPTKYVEGPHTDLAVHGAVFSECNMLIPSTAIFTSGMSKDSVNLCLITKED